MGKYILLVVLALIHSIMLNLILQIPSKKSQLFLSPHAKSLLAISGSEFLNLDILSTKSSAENTGKMQQANPCFAKKPNVDSRFLNELSNDSVSLLSTTFKK